MRAFMHHDYCFLDKKHKTDAAKRGSTGKHKEKRRPSSKTYSDIKFVCTYIERKAAAEGMDITDRGSGNV